MSPESCVEVLRPPIERGENGANCHAMAVPSSAVLAK
jgi:hypothetical protein